MTALLEVTGMRHAYDGGAVLDGVTFTARAGEVLAVVGPSGAGKTTLFRAITRLLEPDAGHVALAGRSLGALSPAQLRLARRDIALLFQHYNLVRRLSALDNVLGGRLAATPAWRVVTRRWTAADRATALAALGRVGLADVADRRADRLSGGQQQRVAIARAMVQRSRVLLADEPVASLDPSASEQVLSTLRALSRDGVAVVCNLHQVDLARAHADRVIGLRGGRVVCDVPAPSFGPAEHAAVYDTAAVPT